jgi:hypothetical protein
MLFKYCSCCSFSTMIGISFENDVAVAVAGERNEYY